VLRTVVRGVDAGVCNLGVDEIKTQKEKAYLFINVRVFGASKTVELESLAICEQKTG
jgi:hypothetical protein